MFDDHAQQRNIVTCANLLGTLGRGLPMNSNYIMQLPNRLIVVLRPLGNACVAVTARRVAG